MDRVKVESIIPRLEREECDGEFGDCYLADHTGMMLDHIEYMEPYALRALAAWIEKLIQQKEGGQS